MVQGMLKWDWIPNMLRTIEKKSTGNQFCPESGEA